MVGAVAVVSALCAIAVVTLGLLFDHEKAASALDESVYSMVYKNFVGERSVLQAMLVPTEPVLLVIIMGLVAMAAVARRRPRLAVLAVVGPLVAVGVNALLKPAIGRTINNGNLAFPSGHTTGLVAVLTVLVLAVATRKSLASLMIAVGFVITIVAAIALIGMKYHYVTDTIGGACLALATVLAVALSIDWVAGKRRRVRELTTSGVAL
jgi:membrane-associated phospholipid phosphatase